MTLLEAVLATVLLALVAIACLDGTGGAARVQQRSRDAAVTLGLAEASLTGAAVGLQSDRAVRVTRRPYQSEGTDASLELVTVEVPGTDGRIVPLSRLVRRTPGGPR